MDPDPKKMLARHRELVHSEAVKVTSHRQREDGDWIINTILIEGHAVPFRYKRRKAYKSLVGAQVNLTYYPTTEAVAGIVLEVMKVVRVRRA